MNKLNKILLIIVVILLVALIFIAWKPNIFGSFKKSQYYAVYLLSGDLYFGKMTWYNPYVLSDVRVVQKEQAGKDSQPNMNLVKFQDIFWGPTGDLKLSKENILWISKLSNESQVVKIINGEK